MNLALPRVKISENSWNNTISLSLVDDAADSDEDADGLMDQRLQHDAVSFTMIVVFTSFPLSILIVPLIYQLLATLILPFLF